MADQAKKANLKRAIADDEARLSALLIAQELRAEEMDKIEVEYAEVVDRLEELTKLRKATDEDRELASEVSALKTTIRILKEALES